MSSKRVLNESAKQAIRELVGVYIGARLVHDKGGAQLMGAALAEDRAAPDAPLDERPALHAFWRWVVENKDYEPTAKIIPA